MYRLHLSEAQREELKQRARQPGTVARTRDRLEMVRLSDAGWSIPRIAQHLRTDEKRAGGFDELPEKPHLGHKSSLTAEILAAIREELSKGERTWTAAQIADWVAQKHGVRLAPEWMAFLLHRAKLSWKRTSRSLKHKQDPEEVKEKAAELAELEKGATTSG